MDKNKSLDLFLQAWLNMTFSLKGNRFLKEASFNEMAICNFLIQGDLTASDICKKTHILKSQVNRILNEMEAKGMITRTGSEEDHRKSIIHFNSESEAYRSEHARVMRLTEAIYNELGVEDTEEFTRLLARFTEIAIKYQNELGNK